MSAKGSSNRLQIGRQLAKEFWIPLVVASLWGIFGASRGEPLAVSSFLLRFAPAFFFVSWLLAQLFRVTKQVKTESSLRQISTRLDDVVTALETSAREAVAWATGGDSYAYFQPILSEGRNPTPSRLALMTVGTYPLFRLHARIADVDALAALTTHTAQSIASTQTNVPLGDLDGDRFYTNIAGLQLGPTTDATDRRFNIFFGGRNGQWVQLLRYRYDDAGWHVGYRVVRTNSDNETEVLEENISGLPNPETIDWG